MRTIPFGNMLMNNVSIRTKMWLLVAVLAVPILVLLGTQFISLQDSVDTTSKERAGVEFETVGLGLVHNLQLHRDHEMLVLRGNAATQAALNQSTAAIDQDFVALRGKADGAGAGRQLTSLQQEWEQLKGTTRTTAIESFGAHTDFIARTQQMLVEVARRNGLFTDSDLASRSVIAALIASMNMSEEIAQGRSMGNLSMTQGAGSQASSAERDAMARYLTTADVYAEELRFNMALAMNADPKLADVLQPLLSKQEQTLGSFSDFANRNFVQATVLDGTRAESFYLLGTSAVTAANDLLATASGNLNEDFDHRTTMANREMQLIGGVAVLGIGLALLLALVVSRSITRPVSHLAEVADRMSLGELDVEIDVRGKNEVGQLAESLRRMQASLRSAIERLRQRRAA